MKKNNKAETSSTCNVYIERRGGKELYISQHRYLSLPFPSNIMEWLNSNAKKEIIVANFRSPINEEENKSLITLLIEVDIDILNIRDIYIPYPDLSLFLQCVLSASNSIRNCVFSLDYLPKSGLNHLMPKLRQLNSLNIKHIDSNSPHLDLVKLFKHDEQNLSSLSITLGPTLFPLVKILQHLPIANNLTELSLTRDELNFSGYVELKSSLMKTVLKFDLNDYQYEKTTGAQIYAISSLLNRFDQKIKTRVWINSDSSQSVSLFMSHFTSNYKTFLKSSMFTMVTYMCSDEIQPKLSVLSLIQKDNWELDFLQVIRK
eukprot:snap_masked-scaffold_30-processed-gene-3.107-mRNA-1 protein AED:1.00 eAED:1.00 QI:0/0/0/0/1/1/2/0/316